MHLTFQRPPTDSSPKAVYELSTVDGKTKLIPVDKEQQKVEAASSGSSQRKGASSTAGSTKRKGGSGEKPKAAPAGGTKDRHRMTVEELVQNLRGGGDPRLRGPQNAQQNPLNGLVRGGAQNPLQGAFPQQHGLAPGVGQNAFNGNLHGLGQNPHALGQNVHGFGQNAHALGQNPLALGQNAHGLGQNPLALAQNAHGLGQNPLSLGQNAHGLGQNPLSLGQNAHGLGQNLHGLGQDPFGGLGQGLNQNAFQFGGGGGLPFGI